MLRALEAALARLWACGCPVAGPQAGGGHQAMASVALRRWRSFSRRVGRRPRTAAARVADLATGLCAAFESDRRLVGPLMADYRHVATVLGEVLLASTLDG